MANLFEKPIAANPMSEFVALPLQFIDQAIQRKQDKYDQARAAMEASDSDLLQTKSLSGDSARHKELLAGYDQELNSMVENAGGDYGAIGAQLDVFKRRLKADMAYGEIGAQNMAYKGAMANKEELADLYKNDKISKSGYDLGVQAISSHITQQGESGQWNTFQGYTPSNITDPIAELRDSVDEINAKYDAKGQKFLSADVIKSNLSAQLTNKPELIRAMKENFMANYRGKTPDKDYAKYFSETIDSVVRDKQYQEKLKVSEGGTSEIRGREWAAINLEYGPGDTTMEGGSMPWLKEMGTKIGVDTTAKFKKWQNSEDGKREIAFMEHTTGTKMPEDHSAKVAWVTKNLNKPVSGKIISTTVPDDIVRGAIRKESGMLLTDGAIRDESGRLLDDDEARAVGGKDDKGHITSIVGMVGPDSGLPYGTLIIVGKDGNTYYQENKDTEILGSKEYATSLINQVKITNTGSKPVTLNRPVIDMKTGRTIFNQGTYKSIYDPKTNTVGMYQNGKLVYGINSKNEVVDFNSDK